jgi:phage major head subunit gpT-like protein
MAVTVTRDLMRVFSATLRTVFDDAFAAQGGAWGEIATLLPSSQAVEEYGWLGEVPRMREWVDERAVKALSEYGFTIRNRKFEATVGVAREALEDEKHGQIRLRVRAMAEAAGAHYDQILFDLINQGETAPAYDGQPFYSDLRQVAGRLVSNLGSSPFSAAALEAAVTAMMKVPLPSGEPMAVTPTHLLVPPALKFQAARVLNSAFYPESSGAGTPGEMAANVLRGELKLVVSPRLASETEWHVLDCAHAVRPFLIQQRTPVEFEALDDPESGEAAFLRDEFLYGVRSRDNAGFGLWQYAYKSTGAG